MENTTSGKTPSESRSCTPVNTDAGRGVIDQIEQIITCLSDSGSPFTAEIERLTDLSGRLEEGRFHLAVLGQFKRGKSTLINALLGNMLLPTSVVPLTAIPTFIQWGDAMRVSVSFETGDDDVCAGEDTEARGLFLHRYVTEEGNPKNHLGVTHVDIFMPSALLSKGVVLIDTPGIGSTYRHNTEATLNFLPQCDAALFLVSADPPITQAEIEFLREVCERVPTLFFVLNKIDYLEEHDRAVALAFLRKTLHDQLGDQDSRPVFMVSARWGLAARTGADADLWRRSGLGELESHLTDFLASEKNAALERAISGKVAGVIETALMRYWLGLRSMELSQSEIDQRLNAFDTELQRVYQEQRIAQDLLAGDHRRAREFLEDAAEKLRHEARAFLDKAVRESGVIGDGRPVDEDVAQEVLAESIPALFEKHFGMLSQQVDKHVSSVLEPHQQRVDTLVEQIRRIAAEIFEIPYRPLESARGFEFKTQPVWITHKWDSSLSPIPPGWFDQFLPGGLQRKRALKRLSQKTDALVLHNVENLRWATLQNMDRTFWRFSRELEECLAETVAATKGAIQATHEKRAQQADQNAGEIERIKARITELETFKSSLSGEN